MFRSYPRECSVAVALLLILILLAVTAPDFYGAANLRDLFLNNAPVLVASVGMTLIILIGQIDVSIGAQFAICGVVAGFLAKAGLPMIATAPLTMAAGAALGSLNGSLVGLLRIPSIVVTLAMMAALRDGLRWATGGSWVSNLPASFQWMGFGQTAGQYLVLAIAAALWLLFRWSLDHVAAGRAVYATGSNEDAARLAGIDTRGVLFGVFAVSGALAGAAALLGAVRFRDIQSNAGIGLEMKTIAAVVIGGASISGGRGTLVGTLLGVALLGVIGPALTFFGVNPYWEKALQGLIILAAVFTDAVLMRRRTIAGR